MSHCLRRAPATSFSTIGRGVSVQLKAGTTACLCSLIRCRAELGLGALRAAHQSARTRAGGFPGALRHDAGDNGGLIAVDLLHQAAAANRQVVMDFWRMQIQAMIVDQLTSGLKAGAITPRS